MKDEYLREKTVANENYNRSKYGGYLGSFGISTLDSDSLLGYGPVVDLGPEFAETLMQKSQHINRQLDQLYLPICEEITLRRKKSEGSHQMAISYQGVLDTVHLGQDLCKNEQYSGIIFFVCLMTLVLLLFGKLLHWTLGKIYGWDFALCKHLPISKWSKQKLSSGGNRVCYIAPDASCGIVSSLIGKSVAVCKVSLRDKHWHIPKLDDIEAVVLEGFCHRFNDPVFWNQKLDLLQQLHRKTALNIFIESDRPLSDVLGFFDTMITKSYGQQWNESFRQEYESLRIAKARCQQIFSDYQVIYVPIQEKTTHSKQKHQVDPELDASKYLGKINQLHGSHTDWEGSHDDSLWMIQSIAEPYYQALWSTLNKKERFLLYDLATDGFVNTKNAHGIRRLRQKGILIYQDRLKIMNESFTNYILTIVDDKAEKLMRAKMKAQGAWGSIKGVLLLIVAGILIFVFMGHQQTLGSIEAILTASMAIFGVIIRLMNFGTAVPKAG